jgi:uncharacterized protein (TIGR02147 family)
MQNISPTSFVNVQEFLVEALKYRQKKNPRFSLRAWSKQLGYQNPSLLSDVLCGRRQPSSDLVRRIAANLELKEKDEASLRDLCKRSAKNLPKSNSNQSTKKVEKGTPNTLELDKFRLISDWHHLVLLEFFLLKGFQSDPKHIVSRLFHKIPRSFVRTALARLQRLGLLEELPNGSLQRTNLAAGLFVGKDISNVAIRNHHHQMIELAIEALDKQATSTRDFSGSTVSIKRTDLPKIREAIYALHSMFNELSAEVSQGEAVYRLNVQLFRVDTDQGECES